MRMKVQAKMTLLTALVLVAILSGLALMRLAQEKRESALFQNEVNESEKYFDHIVKLQGSSLASYVNDYSFWDEMVRFLETRDVQWAADNIVTGLSTFKADAAWVYTADFNLVYSTNIRSASGLSEMSIPRTAYHELFKKDRFCRFFAQTTQGLIEISGASIHPTFDNQRKTPPRGYFFAGRLLTRQLMDELSLMTEFDITISPHRSANALNKQTKIIAFNRPVAGWDGQPLAHFNVSRERPIFNMLKLDSHRQFAMYFISALTLLALSFFFIMRWVSRPLGLITRSLNAQTPLAIQELIGDTTEFGHIAKLIDRFFSQKTELVNEIQERKRAEEGLRKLSRAVEHSPMTVVITDTLGTIEYVNPAFEKITGYGAKEAIGLNPRVLKSGLHPPEFYKAMWDTLTAGNNWGMEMCNKKKNGELYWEYTEIAPVRDAKGHVTHYVAIKEDITERKRVAEELRRAKEAADAANRAKSLFLANMSHEIRTPMNAILGFSQLLQRDPSLLPPQRQNLDIISRSGEHLMELINDILEMSKIEAGRVTLNPAAFNLRDMLKTLELMFRLRADTKRVKFAVSIEDGVPQRIVADEQKIKQVLINLLGNAVKFTTSGSVSLKVWAEKDGKEGLRLFAEVQDTGPGISAEDMGLLFRYFEQTKAGREAASGTGMGLAISREYARLMGGDISVRSQVGQGSVFLFHVVFNEADALAVNAKAQARRVTGLLGGAPAPRVLVVEDEKDEGRLMSRILSPVGFEVYLAADGEEGIRAFGDWRPNLVLMDLIMTGTDGYEAIRRIRAAAGGKEVKILAITASAFEENRVKALAAGADDFVAKPYREEELYEKIGIHLGVSYLYDDKAFSDGGKQGTTDRLSPESFAILPGELVSHLHTATLKGDYDRVFELLGRVEAVDAPLAGELRVLAESYDSQRLIDLLSKGARP